MKNCDNCGNCVPHNPFIPICEQCVYVETAEGKTPSNWKPLPMTNADRLRAMTDEQWVDWARRQMHCGFEHFPCDVVCRGWCDAASGAECERIIMRWLKQPAKGDA